MLRRLALASLSCSLLLAGACKRESSTPPADGDTSSSSVVAPEQEGSEPTTTPPADAPLTCERPQDFGPVLVTATQYANRYAANASKFSEVASTKERPAEVCGIGTGVELIATLTCDDGTNPYKGDRMAAHSSRAGNVGPGGRCGSIIDHYPVVCPEGSYDIYIDSYMCADLAAFQ